MRKLCAASLLAICAAACGGGNHPDPAIIVGGGVHDPGIDGQINIYVIDETDDSPLAGATVQVGTIEGTTDATGLFQAKGDLSGPQTIVAKAANFAPSMWVGVDGANVTIPLTPSVAPTPGEIPQAELAGSINGYDTFPLSANHGLIALVGYSQSRELGDEANNLEPPPSGTNLPSNVCIRIAGTTPDPCAWRINSRTGTVAVGAVLIDVDTMGTPSTADDVQTVVGFAILHPVTVVDGADQTGLTLNILADNPTTASVNFGTPPAGLTEQFGVVGLDLGDEGVLNLSQANPTTSSVVVPSLSSFPSGSYQLLALSGEPSPGLGQSIVLRRGITSPSALSAGEWLAPATGLASDRTTASFTPPPGAAANIIEFNTSSGSGSRNRAMSVAVFDATTTITLPTEFAPLPSGSLDMTVSAFDVPGFDPRDFEIDDLGGTIERLAADTIVLN